MEDEKSLPLANDEEEKKEESLKLNLEPLLNDLKYACILREISIWWLVSSKLSHQQETSLLDVLRKSKETIR